MAIPVTVAGSSLVLFSENIIAGMFSAIIRCNLGLIEITRNCGQVFCAQCSSKTTTLPKFGIEKEVRVCDTCYDKVNKQTTAPKTAKVETELPAEYLNSTLSQQSQVSLVVFVFS